MPFTFKDLYELAEVACKSGLVTYDFVASKVVEAKVVEEVVRWGVDYSPPNGQAYFKLTDDRTSPYDGEYLVADIIYCNSLEHDLAKFRFALVKELMHVFDDTVSRTDTPEKLKQHLRDIQNVPLDRPPALADEVIAQWRALLVLCPLHLRNQMLEKITQNGVLPLEFVQTLVLPLNVITSALDPYYLVAHQALTG